MRHYYAISYDYGWSVLVSWGGYSIVSFATKAERKVWVAQGNPYDGPDYREPVRANDPRVRNWLKLPVNLRAVL